MRQYLKKLTIAKRIAFKILTEIPFPLGAALIDGRITPSEMKDLIKIISQAVAEELVDIARENYEKVKEE